MYLIGQIIFGVFLLLTTLYLIFYVIYPGAGNHAALSTMTPLSKKKDIVTSDVTQQSLLGSAGSSIMGFFKLNNGDRTLHYDHQYIPLIQVENNWALEILPSRTGTENPMARLRVLTSNGTSPLPEYVELPPIPKQKWMFIAILREGRRFDVIYNNKIVASQRLENYPVVISSPLSVGNQGLDGSVIHVIINSSRLTPIQVERERVAHVDTNNTVVEANPINISLPNLSLLAQCPSGLPCNPVTVPPSNHLQQWTTPYA
jgi:hypothetical protein